MTLPDERYRAVLNASRFLSELANDRKKYPRIPLSVRREARSLLKHYPMEFHMDRAAEGAPDVFQAKLDPLHRLILKYEEENKDGQDRI